MYQEALVNCSLLNNYYLSLILPWACAETVIHQFAQQRLDLLG